MFSCNTFSEKIPLTGVKRQPKITLFFCKNCSITDRFTLDAVLTLYAGLLARSQYPEGPATGHLDTGFS
jgi:hypothetical protein